MLDYTELPDDGVRFEQLVRELLIREGFGVHWTGVGPDGGRDLLLTETAAGAISSFTRTWLVSCKHFAHGKRSVGVNDLDKSLIDSCKSAGAEGVLLACSTQASTGLVTRLKEIEQSSGIMWRIWDGVELERRLLTPQAFILVKMMFPATSAQMPWLVHNAGSPSFWCGSFGGHFFYMGARISSGVPRLPDAERIVGLANGVPMAVPGDFGHAEMLRVRNIWFDDRNENYHVSADYLVPTQQGKVTIQSHDAESMLNQLKDGHGLYSDGGSSWYTAYWDVLRIKTDQSSERFFSDSTDFYDPHMERFASGTHRDGATSSFFATSWSDDGII